eukprot:1153225-Pelagomonas_calceolata.AAC.1
MLDPHPQGHAPCPDRPPMSHSGSRSLLKAAQMCGDLGVEISAQKQVRGYLSGTDRFIQKRQKTVVIVTRRKFPRLGVHVNRPKHYVSIKAKQVLIAAYPKALQVLGLSVSLMKELRNSSSDLVFR